MKLHKTGIDSHTHFWMKVLSRVKFGFKFEQLYQFAASRFAFLKFKLRPKYLWENIRYRCLKNMIRCASCCFAPARSPVFAPVEIAVGGDHNTMLSDQLAELWL